jgi:hypothetical protein
VHTLLLRRCYCCCCVRYFDEGADEVAFLNITGFRDCPLEDLPMLGVSGPRGSRGLRRLRHKQQQLSQSRGLLIAHLISDFMWSYCTDCKCLALLSVPASIAAYVAVALDTPTCSLHTTPIVAGCQGRTLVLQAGLMPVSAGAPPLALLLLQVLQAASERVFVPLTVGGGIRGFSAAGKDYPALTVASEYFRCGFGVYLSWG